MQRVLFVFKLLILNMSSLCYLIGEIDIPIIILSNIFFQNRLTSVRGAIPSYKPNVLLLLLLLLLLLWNSCMQQFRKSCTIQDLCLKSKIMDGFWSSRCLCDRTDLFNKIGSFSSGQKWN